MYKGKQKSCASIVYGMLEAAYGVNCHVSEKLYVYETMLKRDDAIFKETLKNSTKEELMLDIEYLSTFRQNETTKLCYDEFMYQPCAKFIDTKIKEIKFYLETTQQERHDMVNPKPIKKKISSTIKKLVWNIHIGENVGKSKCTCCKSTDITQMSFNCGHIVAESKGGKTI